MKRNRLHIAIATAVALGCTLTACTQNNDIAVTDGEHRTPISFNVNIGGLPAPEVSTRGYSSTTINETDTTTGYTFSATDVLTIGIKGKSDAEHPTSRSTSEEIKQYTVSEGISPRSLSYKCDEDGNSTNSFDWLSKNEEIWLRAWCYGNANTPVEDPKDKEFTVETTQSGNIKELLYSKTAVYNYGSIQIPLYHQLARIVVNIKVEKEGYTWADTDEVTIGHDSDGNRVPITGTFSLPTSTNYGSWNVKSYADDNDDYGVIIPKKESYKKKNYDATYSAIVMPADNTIYTSGMKLLNFKVNGEFFFYKLPSATALNPGCQYNFNIKIKNHDISVTGCTINNWGNGSTGGTVTINTLP